MLIFLYGPDSYRSSQKLKEIIAHYREIYKKGLNLKYLDAEENSYEEFKEAFFQAPLFKEKKLIILKNIFFSQQFKENFLKNIKKITEAPEIILILEKKELPEKNKFFQVLKEYSQFSQKFDFLTDEELKKWTKKKIQDLGGRIETPALERLLKIGSHNLWQLANEIEKLINYKKGQIILKNDVELLVREKIEVDIFKTIDALAKKEKNVTLDLIQKHLEKGDNPLYLLSMINFQFRNLLILKSVQSVLKYNFSPLKLAQFLGIHPYVVKKTIFLTNKFSLEELKRIYQKIFETDFNIKLGKVESAGALKTLIAEI